MRNIKLTIEYDGKEFNGWQKQPNKLNIQGTIEKVISDITKRRDRTYRFWKNRCRSTCARTGCKF